MKKYDRHSIRLKGYDYSCKGLYFVTVCVQDRKQLLGNIMEGIMEISYGKNTYLLEEGDSIYYDSIVPHHVHAYEGQAAKILAVVYTPI